MAHILFDMVEFMIGFFTNVFLKLKKSNHAENIENAEIVVSAPGSLMLFGEHAVLHNKKAIVMAIDKRISVGIVKRNDNKIILSSVLGEYKTTISNLYLMKYRMKYRKETIPKDFSFVIAAIAAYRRKIRSGFEVKITSEFSPMLGLGSSAAIVVALLKALSECFEKKPLNKIKLYKQAKKIILKVQGGMGSGADVAASVFGGVLEYQMHPIFIQPLEAPLPITVIYSGYKTPTTEVIKKVQAKFKKEMDRLKRLYQEIHFSTEKAILYVKQNNWIHLGKEMIKAQALMQTLGVSDPILEQTIAKLNEDPNIYGAKISGAGLGDCIIGLGHAANTYEGKLTLSPTLQGVVSHSGYTSHSMGAAE